MDKSDDLDPEDGQQKEDEDISNDKPITSSVKLEAAVLKLSGVDDSTKFSDIKKFFLQYGKVAYVEDVKQNEVFFK